MSKPAKLLAGSNQEVATLEFLGDSFKSRRKALLEVKAFEQVARLALWDSVAVLEGETVRMKFRPSWLLLSNGRTQVPCYSVFDELRTPMDKVVTISVVNHSQQTIVVNASVYEIDSSDSAYSVRLNDILGIERLEVPETGFSPEL